MDSMQHSSTESEQKLEVKKKFAVKFLNELKGAKSS
jgi:hypothetical protein